MRPAALRVGALALLGLLALGLVLVLAGGGRWFASVEPAQLRFTQSVYGLQAGAPVVFRGVRLGQVVEVTTTPVTQGAPQVQVNITLDRDAVQALAGTAGGLGELVRRGLVAQLASQSLLTGQLYVELDVATPVPEVATAAAAEQPVHIPTVASPMHSLQSQLQGLDLAALGRDLAAAAQATRRLLGGPLPEAAFQQATQAAQSLQQLSLRLQQEVPPLAAAARGTLGEASQAAREVGRSAGQVAASTQQAASSVATQLNAQVAGVAAATQPTLQALRQAADELALTAQALREVAGQDSTLRQNAERALQDTARAARSLRELSDTLERHPDALLRGRAAAP